MTPRPNNVRIALPQDEMAVFSLAKMAHEENAVAPISDHKVLEKIRTATNERGGIIGIIGDEQNLEAIIMLELTQQWYSEAWALTELFAFVHPDHRRTTHAKSLIQFSKWAAEKMALPLFIGVLSGERMAAKVRLYRRDLQMSGALFVHNPTFGNLVGSNIQQEAFV